MLSRLVEGVKTDEIYGRITFQRGDNYTGHRKFYDCVEASKERQMTLLTIYVYVLGSHQP
jgi:hypothetical protein